MSRGVAYRAVALAGALVVAGLLVEQLVTLLLALALTVIVSLPLSRAASIAQRRGLPRPLGAIAALVLAIALAAAIGSLVVPQFVSEVKEFASALPKTLAAAERYLHGLTGVGTRTLTTDLSHFAQSYTLHPQRLIGPLTTVGISAAGILAGVVIVLITALYIAINPGPLVNGALRLLAPEQRARGKEVMARVRTAWTGWLVAIGIDMLVLGGLLYLGMRIIGLPFALGFAVFSALMTVIPNYGSIVSAVPPVLLGLSQSPAEGLEALAVYVIVNQIEGNLILPLVMARTVDLHPAVVALGVLVIAALFGLIGVIISIPLISLAIILVDELWIIPQEAAPQGRRFESA
ncbi:MAG: AI-2E family transporter [Actinomycetota bacterium]|nr:AI-2E family transporter [Actinomycetota bacterium]